MSKKAIHFAVLIVLVSVVMFVAFIILDTSYKVVPSKDITELSSVNFNNGEVVALDGQWEFYWSRILYPEDFNHPGPQRQDVTVPHHWTKNGYPSQGIATYRLNTKVNTQANIMALKMPVVSMTAVQVIINGQTVVSNPDLTPEKIPKIIPFKIGRGNIEILVHVVNEINPYSGISESIFLGNYHDIQQLAINNLMVDAFVIIILALMSIVLVIIYLTTQRKNPLVLIVAGICLAFAFSNSGYSERLLFVFFPNLPLAVGKKIIMLIDYSGTILYVFFLRIASRDRVFKIVSRVVYIIYGGYGLAIILLPLSFTIRFADMYVIFNICFFVFLFARMFIKLRKKDYGSMSKSSIVIFLIAFLYPLLYTVALIMYYMAWLNSLWIAQASSIFFSLTLILYLSNQLNESYNETTSALQKLIKVDKLKDEFLINTTHELQTPLNGIINMTESILKEGLGTLSSEQKEYLGMVIKTSKRLGLLVEDIKDLSRIERDDLDLHLRNVEVVAIIKMVVEMLAGNINFKNLQINNSIAADKIYIRGDENRVIQVFYNVLGNAVKFTPKGTVTITCQQFKDCIQIRIEDTGIGITRAEQQKLFTERTVTDSEYGGMGVGLRLSKKLMNLMNGDIYLDWSAKNKGSRFTVVFEKGREGESGNNQLSEVAVSTRAPSLNSNLQQKKYQLLVVDDEPANVYSITGILDDKDISFTVAGNGYDALKAINTHKVDLILLDIMLPGMNGFEVCRIVRQDYSATELPIVLITAKDTIHDLKLGFESGANDFITKPFAANELIARVQNLLALKEAIKTSLDHQRRFLLAQIKPHFIFNTLVSIGVLSRMDADKANDLIEDLSTYLRKVLAETANDSLITLTSELEFLEAYLKIEKVRFGNRFSVEFEVNVKTDTVLIPPLILQPIVENAVLHGVMARPAGGLISININKHDNFIEFVVSDNGQGMNQEQINSVLTVNRDNKGIGLQNINSRLQTTYQEQLEINSKPGEGTVIKFKIPAEEEPR